MTKLNFVILLRVVFCLFLLYVLMVFASYYSSIFYKTAVLSQRKPRDAPSSVARFWGP